MMRSTSLARPTTGSSLPSMAAWVRLRPNWSRTVDDDGVPDSRPPVPAGVPVASASLPW